MAPKDMVKRKDMSPKRRRQLDAIADNLLLGKTAEEMARDKYRKKMAGLAPQEKKKIRARQRAYKRKLVEIIANESYITERVHEEVRHILLAGLPAAVKNLVENAATSTKAESIKLLLEVSRYWSPRQQHDHSGDINIHLNIPRPGATGITERAPSKEADVVEAEVVEE